MMKIVGKSSKLPSYESIAKKFQLKLANSKNVVRKVII